MNLLAKFWNVPGKSGQNVKCSSVSRGEGGLGVKTPTYLEKFFNLLGFFDKKFQPPALKIKILFTPLVKFSCFFFQKN